jgi:torulene dioxygenase
VNTEKNTTLSASHWFDGFNQVHRFQIETSKDSEKTQVFYNSRHTVDNLIENIRKTGSMEGFSFGQRRDPCKSYFQKLQSIFFPAPSPVPDDNKSSRNIGVTLSINMQGLASSPDSQPDRNASGISTLHLKTDASAFSRIDPQTLEPLGMAKQADLHPDLKGQASAAHAKTDPITGDVYNFNLEMGRLSKYRIFHVSASTGKTDILATFTGVPAYLHSLFLTADHVVLCVWNSHYAKGGLSILFNKNIIDSIQDFDSSKPATWYVVDRHNGGLLATYESPAFYAFHSVNAWTEPSSTDTTTPGDSQPATTNDIVAEIPIFENLDILKRFYYENLLSSAPGSRAFAGTKGDSCRPALRRYRLAAVPTTPDKAIKQAKIEWTAPKTQSMELPTINPSYLTRPHRYTYGVVDRGRSSLFDGLVKYDSETHTAKYWEKEGHTAGEAIFIADPEGTEEDSGVLLSTVLDGLGGHSYLICIDARTMEELGRADFKGVVAFGFHGAFGMAAGGALPAT